MWFTSLLGSLKSDSQGTLPGLVRRRKGRTRPTACKPRLEPLEDRCLLSYTITDLGTLPGGVLSHAYGIDNRGHVVGASTVLSDSELHAFVYNHGTMTDLGTLGGAESSANAINNQGQVAGWADLPLGETHAFLFSNGTMHDLGTLGGGHSFGAGINDLGQVVGTSDLSSNGTFYAFLYSNGTMTNLGALGPLGSFATGINNDGLVVGSTNTPSGYLHGFLYLRGTMHDLGTLGGLSSEAAGINSFDQIVGSADLPSGDTHAFLFSRGTMHDLGTLGGSTSYGYGMNDLGQVVGVSNLSGQLGVDSFIYSNGTMTDLNSQLPPGSGFTFITAYAINDNGQIIGDGLDSSGLSHALLFTPTRSDQFSQSIVAATLAGLANPTGAAPRADTAACVEILSHATPLPSAVPSEVVQRPVAAPAEAVGAKSAAIQARQVRDSLFAEARNDSLWIW